MGKDGLVDGWSEGFGFGFDQRTKAAVTGSVVVAGDSSTAMRLVTNSDDDDGWCSSDDGDG